MEADSTAWQCRGQAFLYHNHDHGMYGAAPTRGPPEGRQRRPRNPGACTVRSPRRPVAQGGPPTLGGAGRARSVGPVAEAGTTASVEVQWKAPWCVDDQEAPCTLWTIDGLVGLQGSFICRGTPAQGVGVHEVATGIPESLRMAICAVTAATPAKGTPRKTATIVVGESTYRFVRAVAK